MKHNIIAFTLFVLCCTASADFISDLLQVHNDLRDVYNIPHLTWSSDLAVTATEWAQNIASNGDLSHSKQRGRGENVAYRTSGSGSSVKMAQGWGNERQNFIPGSKYPDVSKGGKVGHYTQMIWSESTKVGCGLATEGDRDYLVCQYTPAGNIYGHYVYTTSSSSSSSSDLPYPETDPNADDNATNEQNDNTQDDTNMQDDSQDGYKDNVQDESQDGYNDNSNDNTRDESRDNSNDSRDSSNDSRDTSNNDYRDNSNNDYRDNSNNDYRDNYDSQNHRSRHHKYDRSENSRDSNDYNDHNDSRNDYSDSRTRRRSHHGDRDHSENDNRDNEDNRHYNRTSQSDAEALDGASPSRSDDGGSFRRRRRH